MIGNISFAGDSNQLNYLIQLRTSFKNGQVEMYKQKGDNNFQPNKLKIIILDDMSQCGDNCLIGSILLPNTRALIKLTEGDYNGFTQEYINKLESPDIQEYIVILLAGLVERNFDYIFFFNNDDQAMVKYISNVLFTYLFNKFGIIVYDCMSNSALFACQSVDSNRFMQAQNLIIQYKMSNREPSLFWQF